MKTILVFIWALNGHQQPVEFSHFNSVRDCAEMAQEFADKLVENAPGKVSNVRYSCPAYSSKLLRQLNKERRVALKSPHAAKLTTKDIWNPDPPENAFTNGWGGGEWESKSK